MACISPFDWPMESSPVIVATDSNKEPKMTAADLTMGTLTLVMALGLVWVTARHSKPLALVVAAGLFGWLSLTAGLAGSGLLSAWDSRPPRLPLLPLTAFAIGVLLNRTEALAGVRAATPRAWLVGAQTFRVAVELALFGFFLEGRAPVQMTFEGRNLDIVVGLAAPLVAWAIARKRAAPAVVLAFNVAGLLVLSNTIATAITSVPGPLLHAWPGGAFPALATWPLVWLPSFLAPLAIFLHVASIRQTLPLLRRSAAAPGAA
jgi:hypothetical protein